MTTPATVTDARPLGAIPRSTDKPVKRNDETRYCHKCSRKLSPYNLTVTCGPCDQATTQARRPW